MPYDEEGWYPKRERRERRPEGFGSVIVFGLAIVAGASLGAWRAGTMLDPGSDLGAMAFIAFLGGSVGGTVGGILASIWLRR